MNKEIKNLKLSFLAEWLKTKNLGLVWIGLFLAIFPGLLGLIIKLIINDARVYEGVSQSVFHKELCSSSSGLLQFSLYIFIIIACSRVAQTDHKNQAWTLIETQPISKLSIYLSKFLVVFCLCVILIITNYIFSNISSIFLQIIYPQKELNFSFDVFWHFQLLIRLVLLSIGLISLQLMLSVLIPGFIWPFMFGFLGFISNIVAQVRRETYDFSPYNYLYTSSITIDGEEINHFFNYSDYLSVFWAILFLFIGYNWYKSRDFKKAFYINKSIKIKSFVMLVGLCLFYFLVTKPIYNEKSNDFTLIEGEITTENPPKEIYLFSKILNEKIASIELKNKKFKWKSTQNLDFGEYFLKIDNKQLPFVLAKGDEIYLDFRYNKKATKLICNGTRKAEIEFMQDNNSEAKLNLSNAFKYMIDEKSLVNQPKEFYEECENEWNTAKRTLQNFRTKENIHYASDFKTQLLQLSAVDLLNAMKNYQMMTSLSDKKFAAPQKFQSELESMLSKPSNYLLSRPEYLDYKLSKISPENNSKESDQLILSKINLMPKSLQKDQLLTHKLMKMMELINIDVIRNQLFQSELKQFQNNKFIDFLKNHITILNNQQKGKNLPNLILEDLNGKLGNLNQYKGKWLVIDFWATWCAPCKRTSPIFEHFANSYKYQQKIAFVSISIDENLNKWKLDLKNKSLQSEQFIVQNKEFLSEFGVNSIPRFVLINPNGTIENSNFPSPDDSNFELMLNDYLKNIK